MIRFSYINFKSKYSIFQKTLSCCNRETDFYLTTSPSAFPPFHTIWKCGEGKFHGKKSIECLLHDCSKRQDVALDHREAQQSFQFPTDETCEKESSRDDLGLENIEAILSNQYSRSNIIEPISSKQYYRANIIETIHYPTNIIEAILSNQYNRSNIIEPIQLKQYYRTNITETIYYRTNNIEAT